MFTQILLAQKENKSPTIQMLYYNRQRKIRLVRTKCAQVAKRKFTHESLTRPTRNASYLCVYASFVGAAQPI